MINPTVKPLLQVAPNPNIYIFCPFLQLSLPSPLKPGVNSGMKMQLEQHQQAMLQLHLSDQQIYCLLRCTYIRGLKVIADVKYFQMVKWLMVLGRGWFT